MSASVEPLIETAVRNFGDDIELRQAAREALAALAEEPAGEGSGEMIARWNAVDGRPRQLPWRWLPAVLVMLAIALSLTADRRARKFYPKGMAALNSPQVGANIRVELMKRSWTPEQKLLLFGDVSKSSPADQHRALWEAHPEDAACFAEYVAFYQQQHHDLPGGFPETAEKIDPRNALFPYLAASVAADGAVEKLARTAKEIRARQPAAWKIKDAAKLDEALALAAAATEKPDFNTHRHELDARRIPLLPQEIRTDSFNLAAILFWNPSSTLPLRKLSEAFTAKAAALSRENDRAGFPALLASMEAFDRLRLGADHPTLVDLMVIQNDSPERYRVFQQAAATLGFPEQAARLRATADRLQARQDAKAARPKAAGKKYELSRSGYFALEDFGMLERQLVPPRPLQGADWLPGSYSEHAVVWRLMVILLALLLGLGAGILSLNRWIAPVLTRRLAVRMESLFTTGDYLLIFTAGILAPLAYGLVISRLTPLGGREWGAAGPVLLLLGDHFLAMLLLAGAVPLLLVQRRLRRRTGPLALGGRRRWFGWSAVALAVIQVPAMGWVALNHPYEQRWLLAVALLLSPLLLWLAGSMLRGPFGGERKRLAASTACRVMLPVLGWAMVGLLCLVPVFRAEENYWYRRFEKVRITPENAPVTNYEADVAAQLQRELRTAFGL